MTDTAARVICATCRHWQLRAAHEQGRRGFAACSLSGLARTVTAARHHGCAQHGALDADSIARRLTQIDRSRTSVHEEAA